MSYRLDVVSTSIAQAIRQLGGLMVDCSLAGWYVTVITDQDSDSQALTALGAGIASPERREPLLVLIQDSFRVAVHPSDAGPPHLTRRHHELSSAAILFKTHALRLLGVDTNVQAVEEYWSDRHAAGLSGGYAGGPGNAAPSTRASFPNAVEGTLAGKGLTQGASRRSKAVSEARCWR